MHLLHLTQQENKTCTSWAQVNLVYVTTKAINIKTPNPIASSLGRPLLMYKLPSANNMKPPLFLRVDESELHWTWAAVLTAVIPELSINILFMLMIKAEDGVSACLTFICGYIHLTTNYVTRLKLCSHTSGPERLQHSLHTRKWTCWINERWRDNFVILLFY